MIVSRKFCSHVVNELNTPGTIAHKLRSWFVNGTVVVEGVGRVKPHIPDETFFPSVLMRSPFREKGVPKPVEVIKDVTSATDPTAEKVFWLRGCKRQIASRPLAGWSSDDP